MTAYQSYYRQNLSHAQGLKWVPGGTGLGKTRGIKELLADPETRPERKCIYIANRHNLLQEMAEGLADKRVPFAYLKADPDIVFALIEAYPPGLSPLWEELDRMGFWHGGLSQTAKRTLEQQARQIYQLRRRLSPSDQTVQALLEQQARKLAQSLYRSLRSALKELSHQQKARHQQLLQKPLIQQLFPFVQFAHQAETPVLLATVQKLMHGFFDGREVRKLPSLEGYILFMDEFDFLENEMLSILCQEPMLANPMDFIRAFYEGYQRWREVPFWSREEVMPFREAFDQIVAQNIERPFVQKTLRFPETLYFRAAPGLSQKQTASLFQTNHSTILRPFYLRAEGHHWEIHERPVAGALSYPGDLFQFLSQTTRRILGVFNQRPQLSALRDQIIKRLWDRLNDTQPGAYRKYISENYHFQEWRKKVRPEHETTETPPDPSNYWHGYRLFRLIQENDWDHGQAELSALELTTSPEAIIAHLARQNLVFALSATVDIPRSVQQFDFRWLAKQAPFLPLTEADRQCIQGAQAEKSALRQNTVQLKVFPSPRPEQELARLLQLLQTEGFFQPTEEESTASAAFRQQRVEKFFQVLDWILTESEGRHHLLFCTTFQQIDALLSQDAAGESAAIRDLKRPLWQVQGREIGRQVHYRGQTVNLLFLNKAKALEIEAGADPEAYQRFFLEENAAKTLVVTQYATASNGVNLAAWEQANGTARAIDFHGIHLLEKMEFWFEQINRDDYDQRAARQLVWYLWKLQQKGALASSRFKLWVNQLNQRAANHYYKAENSECRLDYLRNAVALFYQALGRVDRQWQRTPLTEVSFDQEILKIFASYLTLDEDRVENRKDYTASLMLALHEEIDQAASQLYRTGLFAAHEELNHSHFRSQTLIQHLLAQIEMLKAGSLDPEQAVAVRQAWEDIREAVLQQNFEKRIPIAAYKEPICTGKQLGHRTQFAGRRFLHLPSLKLYPTQILEEQVIEWNPNRHYYPIAHNESLRSGFEQKGWPTHFPRYSPQLWTPYIEQAVLRGAIGEEAIRLLLEAAGLQTQALAEEVYEVADFHLAETAVFVDAKYFSSATLDQYLLDDPYASDFQSEPFLAKCATKYQALLAHTGDPETQLVILNLIGPPEGRNSYYRWRKEGWEPTDIPEEAQLTLIPAALCQDQPERTTPAFQSWLERTL